MRVEVKQQNRLPREGVGASCRETFKIKMDKALSNEVEGVPAN